VEKINMFTLLSSFFPSENWVPGFEKTPDQKLLTRVSWFLQQARAKRNGLTGDYPEEVYS
jgi:hypothetical protein